MSELVPALLGAGVGVLAARADHPRGVPTAWGVAALLGAAVAVVSGEATVHIWTILVDAVTALAGLAVGASTRRTATRWWRVTGRCAATHHPPPASRRLPR